MRGAAALLGPAFVASVAYVDPGNVATNTEAGARFRYELVWVVVAANVLAMLVQYLSAKLGLATGASLPELCRARLPRTVVLLLWLQAEAVAIATDLAEVLGGAIALQLLFGVPLIAGAVLTGLVTVGLLTLQRAGRQRRYEQVVQGMLAVIFVGFLYAAAVSGFSPRETVAGLLPRLQGHDDLLVAVGILGATVMPHVVYLHSALIRDRYGEDLPPARRRALLGVIRTDVVIAMTLAGVVNLAMLVLSAAALGGHGDLASITAAHDAVSDSLGRGTGLLVALALLASGFASSSVGTYAGAVVMSGFLRRQLPLTARRLLTLAPAVGIVALGVSPTRALVGSQVALSFGIPFALWPLVALTARRDVMGEQVNRRATTVAAALTATVITVLNAALVVSVVGR